MPEPEIILYKTHQDLDLFTPSGMAMSHTQENIPVQGPEKRMPDAIEELTLPSKAVIPIFGSRLSGLQYAC
jgi:hypothetical protein